MFTDFPVETTAKIFDLIYCTFCFSLIYQAFSISLRHFFRFLSISSILYVAVLVFIIFQFLRYIFALNSSVSSTLFSPYQGGFYCSLFQFRKRSFFFLFNSSKPFVFMVKRNCALFCIRQIWYFPTDMGSLNFDKLFISQTIFNVML